MQQRLNSHASDPTRLGSVRKRHRPLLPEAKTFDKGATIFTKPFQPILDFPQPSSRRKA